MAGVGGSGFRIKADRLDVNKITGHFSARGHRAMIRAVTWWKNKTVKHIPVKRGQTKQQTQQFVKREQARTIGGLTFGTFYSIYLIQGAETKSGGGVLEDVKRWAIGMEPISSWPAKKGKRKRGAGGRFIKGGGGSGNKNAMLPVALPFLLEAREVLKEQMRG